MANPDLRVGRLALAQMGDGSGQGRGHDGETACGQGLMRRQIQPEQQGREDQSAADSQQTGQPSGEQSQSDEQGIVPPGQHGFSENMTSSMPATGRLLPTLQADGHWQMALDQMLLEQTHPAPVLRFYRWDGPWLSLGRHQRQWPDHWNALAEEGRLSAWCDAPAEVGPCCMPAVSPMP